LDPVDPLVVNLQEVTFRIPIAAAVTADTHTITVPWKCRVIDAWTVAGGSTYHTSVDQITVGDGTNAITNALDITEASDTAGLLDRTTTVDPTYAVIEKGGTIVGTVGTVTCASAPAGELYIRVQVLPTSKQ